MSEENTGLSARENAAEALTAKTPQAAPMHKTVLCQKCGKRMLIEVGEGQRIHRCPVCKVAFQVFCQAGVMTVIFASE